MVDFISYEMARKRYEFQEKNDLLAIILITALVIYLIGRFI